MISKKIEKAINDQIAIEEQSSRIYLIMASWCETKGYTGSAAFLFKQSAEERSHQLKLMRYLNEREGFAVLSKNDTPEVKFKSLPEVFEMVLKHEKFVTGSVHKLYGLCLEEKDYPSQVFVQWFINEQVEEEGTARAILEKFKLAGTNAAGIYIIDRELAGMAS